MIRLKRLIALPSQIVSYLVVILGFVAPFTLLMRVLNRTRVFGKINLQIAQPPFLFCSNHVSMLDDAFVGSLVFMPRVLWDYRFIPYHLPERKNFFKGPFFSWLMRAAKCIPITRGEGVHQAGMEKTIGLLKRGNVAYVYPEGTRTRTGELGRGKMGVGRLVRETGVKVIPCYHQGLDKVLPIGHKIPRFGQRIGIWIGEALDFKTYMTMPNTPKTWQVISDRIVDAIRQLRDENGASGEVAHQAKAIGREHGDK
jgi:1-acyl-sn-glycerol-3-phosphate acyltransferase